MSDPLKTPRIVALFLSWAFAVAAAGVGLNALVNENRDIKHITSLAPAPTVVNVNVSDVDTAGKVATIANVILAAVAFGCLALSLLPATHALAVKTLKVQGLALLVPTLVVLGGMIPFMIFFASRSAKVTAFIGATQLPASLVAQVQAASGQESEYKKIGYLRLLAIFPWLSIFFAIVAIAVVFISSSRATTSTVDHTVKSESKSSVEEKGSTSHTERVEA